MKITKEFLLQFDINSKNLAFFERNFPNGLNTDSINLIFKFDVFWDWLIEISNSEFTYDVNGRILKKVCNDNSSEFDASDSLIKILQNGKLCLEIKEKPETTLTNISFNVGDHYPYQDGSCVRTIYICAVFDDMVCFKYLGDFWRKWEYEVLPIDRVKNNIM